MALPLISITIVDTRNDYEACRQLASAVVAQSFNEYMIHTMHEYYVKQLSVIKKEVYEWAISEGEEAEAKLARILDLMKSSFFRRVYRIRKKIMRHGIDRVSAQRIIEQLDAIIVSEWKAERNHGYELERLFRFFHSDLFNLYSMDRIDLAKALDRCHEEIWKERERIR